MEDSPHHSGGVQSAGAFIEALQKLPRKTLVGSRVELAAAAAFQTRFFPATTTRPSGRQQAAAPRPATRSGGGGREGTAEVAARSFSELKRSLGAQSTATVSPPVAIAQRPAPPQPAETPRSLKAPTIKPPGKELEGHEETAADAHAPDDSIQLADERPRLLARLRSEVLPCEKCAHLAASRTQVVFGTGNPCAELMFVGEAPGADEDRQGEPFVGAAGKLLTKMILAMGMDRADVYIANVLKCRPDTPGQRSGKRPPTAEEMAVCLPYLRSQISIIRPRAIVALGSTAVQGLFGMREVQLKSLRGRWKDLEVAGTEGAALTVPVMVTYHPAYLLRNQSVQTKRIVWEDLLQVLERLELPISEKQRRFFTQTA